MAAKGHHRLSLSPFIQVQKFFFIQVQKFFFIQVKILVFKVRMLSVKLARFKNRMVLFQRFMPAIVTNSSCIKMTCYAGNRHENRYTF